MRRKQALTMTLRQLSVQAKYAQLVSWWAALLGNKVEVEACM